MKKIIPILICISLLLSGCFMNPVPNNTDPLSEGAVSDSMQTTIIDDVTYYLIKTEGELLSIGKGYPLSGNYALGNDLTLSGEWSPIGDENEPFTGTFDGGEYTIYKLTVNNYSDKMGFFGASEGAVIRNLALKDAEINHQVSFPIVNRAADTVITNCSINADE